LREGEGEGKEEGEDKTLMRRDRRRGDVRRSETT
jgi:hypothetical protein